MNYTVKLISSKSKNEEYGETFNDLGEAKVYAEELLTQKQYHLGREFTDTLVIYQWEDNDFDMDIVERIKFRWE